MANIGLFWFLSGVVSTELPPIPDPLKVELKVAELGRYYQAQDSLMVMAQLGNPKGVVGAAAGRIGGDFLTSEFRLKKGKEYTDYLSSKLRIDWTRAIGPILGNLGFGYEENSCFRVWQGVESDLALTLDTRWGGVGLKTRAGWSRFLNQEFLSLLTDLELLLRSSLKSWGLKGIYTTQWARNQIYIEANHELSDGLHFVRLSAGYEPILGEPSFKGEFGTGRPPLLCWLGVDYAPPISVRFDTLYRPAAPMEVAPDLEPPRSQQGLDFNLRLGPAYWRLFYQKVASFIYWDDLDQDSLIQPANRDVITAGTGLTLITRLPHLENWIGLTYERMNPGLPLRPSLSLQDSLTLLWEGLRLQIIYSFSSARYLSGRKLEPYHLFSSWVGYRIKGFEIFLQVENILGGSYEEIPYHPAEGRRYSIGVSFIGYRTRILKR